MYGRFTSSAPPARRAAAASARIGRRTIETTTTTAATTANGADIKCVAIITPSKRPTAPTCANCNVRRATSATINDAHTAASGLSQACRDHRNEYGDDATNARSAANND